MARSNDATATRYLRSTPATNYLSGSGGPFTVMFWLKTAAVGQTNKYLASVAGGTNDRLSFLYGYVNSGGNAQIEAFGNDNATSAIANIRTGSQITISDTNWHHIAYRKAAAGTSEWAYFLDGTKTVINAAVAFTLNTTATPTLSVFTDPTSAVWLNGALAELILDATSWDDKEILALARGRHPRRFKTVDIYYPLHGDASPEPSWATADKTSLTMTGTLAKANHAPVETYSGAFARAGVLPYDDGPPVEQPANLRFVDVPGLRQWQPQRRR